MKKLIFIYIALSFCSISFAQWTNQVSGTTENLYAIQFINSNIGYIVGSNGTILKTIDSGSNWTSLNSNTTTHLSSVFFVDNNTGFVSGSYYNMTTNTLMGILLKTTDGGLNWINLNFPFEENISDIFFLNSNIGFASCGSDGILRTSDGGLSWTKVSSNNTRATFFPSDLIGYSINAGISKTTDGGLNWTQIKDDNSPDYNSVNILTSLFFNSETKGFFGSPYYGGMYSTINGGTTLEFVGPQTISIHFPSENIGYALTSWDGSAISQTINSGNTWNVVHQNTLPLNDIFFNTNSKGWAIGEQGTILYNNNVSLSINSMAEVDNKISIYPNPSNSSISINTENDISIVKLSIYNSLGMLISEYNSSQKTIEVGKFPQGIYLLKIETNKGRISKKIIKKTVYP